MASIHDVTLDYIEDELRAALITEVDDDDIALVGHMQQGPSQGSPAPDAARISVTIHENDPDAFFDNPASAIKNVWPDEIAFVETSQVITWKRRFTIKARCLLVRTKETKDVAREIASTLRTRLEDTLLSMDYTDVEATNGEYVSRKAVAKSMKSEMIQAGGPPNSFDYHIKVRFDVLTTTRSFV